MQSTRELPARKRFLIDDVLDLGDPTETRVDATDRELQITVAIEERARLRLTIPGVSVPATSVLVAANDEIRGLGLDAPKMECGLTTPPRAH